MQAPTSAQLKKTLAPTIGAIIEFIAGEEKGRQVPLVYIKTVLGRKFGDILIRDLKVSGTHLAIEYRKNRFFVVDLGSSNGTFLSGDKIKEAPLNEGDEVHVGFSAFRLFFDADLFQKLNAQRPVETTRKEGGLTELIEEEFIRDKDVAAVEHTQSMTDNLATSGLLFVAVSGPSRGQKFSITGPSTVIGRANADVNLKDPDVSRKHAIIERQDGGQVVLRDLASRNGTFVNDRRVSNCVLNKGDQIKMGQTVLLFNGWLHS